MKTKEIIAKLAELEQEIAFLKKDRDDLLAAVVKIVKNQQTITEILHTLP